MRDFRKALLPPAANPLCFLRPLPLPEPATSFAAFPGSVAFDPRHGRRNLPETTIIMIRHNTHNQRKLNTRVAWQLGSLAMGRSSTNDTIALYRSIAWSTEGTYSLHWVTEGKEEARQVTIITNLAPFLGIAWQDTKGRGNHDRRIHDSVGDDQSVISP